MRAYQPRLRPKCLRGDVLLQVARLVLSCPDAYHPMTRTVHAPETLQDGILKTMLQKPGQCSIVGRRGLDGGLLRFWRDSHKHRTHLYSAHKPLVSSWYKEIDLTLNSLIDSSVHEDGPLAHYFWAIQSWDHQKIDGNDESRFETDRWFDPSSRSKAVEKLAKTFRESSFEGWGPEVRLAVWQAMISARCPLASELRPPDNYVRHYLASICETTFLTSLKELAEIDVIAYQLAIELLYKFNYPQSTIDMVANDLVLKEHTLGLLLTGLAEDCQVVIADGVIYKPHDRVIMTKALKELFDIMYDHNSHLPSPQLFPAFPLNELPLSAASTLWNSHAYESLSLLSFPDDYSHELYQLWWDAWLKHCAKEISVSRRDGSYRYTTYDQFAQTLCRITDSSQELVMQALQNSQLRKPTQTKALIDAFVDKFRIELNEWHPYDELVEKSIPFLRQTSPLPILPPEQHLMSGVELPAYAPETLNPNTYVVVDDEVVEVVATTSGDGDHYYS